MKRFDDKNGTDDKKKRKRILFMAGLIAVIIITAALFYFNSFVMKNREFQSQRFSSGMDRAECSTCRKPD